MLKLSRVSVILDSNFFPFAETDSIKGTEGFSPFKTVFIIISSLNKSAKAPCHKLLCRGVVNEPCWCLLRSWITPCLFSWINFCGLVSFFFLCCCLILGGVSVALDTLCQSETSNDIIGIFRNEEFKCWVLIGDKSRI